MKTAARRMTERVAKTNNRTEARRCRKLVRTRAQRASLESENQRLKAVREAIHDIYNSKAYKEWRMYVFTRDKFTCQMCGHNGGNLECHHIFPKAKFPERVIDPTNGITLCYNCHQKIVTGSEMSFTHIFPIIVDINTKIMEGRK